MEEKEALPTVVVSGFMRSGTSMMMKALESGGLPVVYNEARNSLVRRMSDDFYNPNVGGLYELQKNQYNAKDFPYKYQGQCFKLLYGGLPGLPPIKGDYKIIFMRRDPKLKKQSYEAFFNVDLPQSEKDIEQNLDKIVSICNMRKDMELIELEYETVLENSQETLKQIANLIQPHNFNIEEASKVPTKKHQHYV